MTQAYSKKDSSPSKVASLSSPQKLQVYFTVCCNFGIVSKNSLFRNLWYALLPLILIAENKGGVCLISPLKFFKTDLFAKEIYYLSSLPSRLNYSEVAIVIIVSLIISFISTLLPSFRASKIDPITTIKNE